METQNNIKAEIIADSLNPQRDRLTTFKLTYPRIIHSEIMTHRMFSRNSASSRAIPFNKMVESVQNNPFIPIAWQKEHKGMQGYEYLNEKEFNECRLNWLGARDKAIEFAKDLTDIGCTKQLANRLLEPFMYHTIILTTGKEGLENFFKLRNPVYEIDLDNIAELKS